MRRKTFSQFKLSETFQNVQAIWDVIIVLYYSVKLGLIGRVGAELKFSHLLNKSENQSFTVYMICSIYISLLT